MINNSIWGCFLINLYGCKQKRLFTTGEICAQELNKVYKCMFTDMLHQIPKNQIILIQDFNKDLYEAIERTRKKLVSILISKNPNKIVNSFEDLIVLLFDYIKSQLIQILNKTAKLYKYNFDIGTWTMSFSTCYDNSLTKWPILFYNDELK